MDLSNEMFNNGKNESNVTERNISFLIPMVISYLNIGFFIEMFSTHPTQIWYILMLSAHWTIYTSGYDCKPKEGSWNKTLSITLFSI